MKKIVFLPILFPFHDLVVKWSVSLRSTAERFVVDNNELRILLTSIPLFQLWEFEFSREAGCWTAVEFDSISVDFSNSPRREFFKYSFRVAPIREVEPKYLTRDSWKMLKLLIREMKLFITDKNCNFNIYFEYNLISCQG